MAGHSERDLSSRMADPLTREQIEKGGARLAAVLNTTLR
jgi:hypothetical protein